MISPREAVARYIREHPGTHHRLLARRLGLAGATIHHHLRNLRAEGRVIPLRDGRYVRYFTADAAPETRALWSHLARDVPGRILRALLTLERASAREIATASGLREATVGANLTRLARAGVVERDRHGGRFVYSIPPEPRRALREMCSTDGVQEPPVFSEGWDAPLRPGVG